MVDPIPDLVALDAAVAHRVSTGRDASYDPRDTVSVIQAGAITPLGSLPVVGRLAHRVSGSVTSTAPTLAGALAACSAVIDTLESMSTAGGWRVSSTRVTGEPRALPAASPSGAAAATAQFTTIIRRREEDDEAQP